PRNSTGVPVSITAGLTPTIVAESASAALERALPAASESAIAASANRTPISFLIVPPPREPFRASCVRKREETSHTRREIRAILPKPSEDSCNFGRRLLQRWRGQRRCAVAG